ncbi:cache domain-containing protein (plasmid) [Agrobacterium vaccinii]|uniref:methyl-accepting chemotaxis protein n=1 Tax=Agrobacterium TaxID=357 RepID=UPI000DD02B5C|nr:MULTISPECIES: methyl-accepting chemotaxis protein [Agrobacterium]UHS64425.1 cache domain-containing protein [Agrobacterium vaccinii]
MKRLKISTQLALLVGGLVLAFSIATFFQIRSSSETIYQQRYEMLRTETETAISVLKLYDDKAKAGQLTLEQARQQAFDLLVSMRYEPDGYFFAYDRDINMLFHYDTKRIGQNFKNKPDPTGNLYREKLVDLAIKGGGRVDFMASKPGADKDAFFRKTAYAAEYKPWGVIINTGLYMDDLEAEVNNAIWKAISIGFGILIFAIAAAIVIIRGITKPLSEIHNALGEVANENVAMAIPHTNMKNEVGMMAKATEALQQKVRERHDMQLRQEEQQNQLDSERQSNLDTQRGEAELQARVVATIGEALEKLAQGDLTVRCRDLGTRYADLRDNFNEALAHLDAAMARVNSKGIDIGGSKDEIRKASSELSQRTERQAANLEETSAALDELTVAVRQTADGAHEAAKRVGAVSTEATRSDRVVEEAIGAMTGIEQSSAEISKIIGVIDEIAFQTNLLALNAGVEAARAGESGKGFAVVAQEVRELAQRSAAAAKEIKDQIARSSSQVQNGVRLVGEAGEALKRISDQIKSANDIVGKIAHSASEQDTTLRSISSSLNQLDLATQHNAAMAEETTASAESLSVDTEELLNLIRTFRVSGSQNGSLHGMAQEMRRAS